MPELWNNHSITTRPILWVLACMNPTMEARPLPIHRTLNQAVLYRIEMDVVEMAFKIVLFFNRVLPKLRLPNSAPTIIFSSLRDFTFGPARRKPTLRELGLNPLPTPRVVRVTARHAPNRMKMVRQQHNRANLKRMRSLTFANDISKNRPRICRREDRPTLIGHNGKEKRSTWNNGTSPIGHAAMINDVGPVPTGQSKKTAGRNRPYETG